MDLGAIRIVKTTQPARPAPVKDAAGVPAAADWADFPHFSGCGADSAIAAYDVRNWTHYRSSWQDGREWRRSHGTKHR